MEVSSVMNSWEDLRKQARKLENEIDLKLVSFNKLGAGHNAGGFKQEGEASPLIDNDQIFADSQEDLEKLLSKLSAINEKMGDFSTGQALHFTRERHKEVLQEYNREFQKIKSNYQSRRERENLLNSVRKDIDNYKSNSGLNRRMDLYLKENEHIRSSDRLIDEQISIAVETKDHLVHQRLAFKKFQTKLNDLSNRFPLVNNLMQKISFRKRRDSIILGVVVSFCIILLFLYAFR